MLNVWFWIVIAVMLIAVFPGIFSIIGKNWKPILRVIAGIVFGILFVFPFSIFGEAAGYVGAILGFAFGFTIIFWAKLLWKFIKWVFKKIGEISAWWVKFLLIGGIVVAIIILVVSLF